MVFLYRACSDSGREHEENGVDGDSHAYVWNQSANMRQSHSVTKSLLQLSTQPDEAIFHQRNPRGGIENVLYLLNWKLRSR